LRKKSVSALGRRHVSGSFRDLIYEHRKDHHRSGR
jgi:hypothetical protein